VTTAHIAGALGVLLLFVLPAFLTARLAARKGRPFWLYLVASLLIGWPIPLLAAIIVRKPREAR
jgi:hypothetical protein